MPARPERLRFEIRVVARAARNGISGTRDGALVVRVTAPPVEGAANAAVARVLAEALGIAAGDVAIERGARGRRKVVSIPAAAGGRLAALK